MEPIDVAPTELDYIRTADISAGAAKYHQNDYFFKTVTDIALVCSAKIMDDTAKSIRLSKMLP